MKSIKCVQRGFLLMIAMFFLTATVLLPGGCAEKPKKMLSEDVDTLKVFAPEIAVMKNPELSTTSFEKYQAAKRLAEGIDFSLTRNVATLDQMFLASDATQTRALEYGDEIVFYFQYQDKYVRMRFWRSGNMVTESEIRIK